MERINGLINRTILLYKPNPSTSFESFSNESQFSIVKKFHKYEESTRESLRVIIVEFYYLEAFLKYIKNIKNRFVCQDKIQIET